ncbi:glycosyltransferase [Neobacillus sp. YX16]|uniref:glycosyltransferase n=1 Tax=Neobacillus sp. YX16 TaxID=3047874 RepID=UPI0024C29C1E|nr:glycosyltransferase [Neobacillus sp. YX16]WHZ02380.1 glycosyltransferase [Neobacillus sp. YX16]
MKVLIFPSWYPTPDSPINGIFFKEQAKSLVRKQIDATVLYSEAWSIKGFKLFDPNRGTAVQVEDQVPTYRYKDYNYALNFIQNAAGKQYLKRIKKLYLQYKNQYGKPDIIHAHSVLWGGWAASKIAKEEGIPFVLTEHSSSLGRGLLSDSQINELRQVYQAADKLIAVSPSLKILMQSLVPGKAISIIPNIVDLSHFTLKSPKDLTGKFRFFSLAFLNKNKGMDILIEAFAKSFKGNKKVELIIGGKGQEKENLMQLTENLGVSDMVHFRGELDRVKTAEEMKKANAFVLASRYETFGVVYIEALASGTPVIGTKCGGPEMIIDSSNGLLVDIDDVAQLSEALRYMERQAKEYNPSELRENCLNRFGEQIVVSEIIKIYEECR